MVVISGRDVSDFVLEFWIVNFELFLLHFILESSSEMWNLKSQIPNSKSEIQNSKTKNELQTLDGYPWTLLEAMDGQMNMSMIAILRKLLMMKRKTYVWNLKAKYQRRSLKFQNWNVVAIHGHHSMGDFKHPSLLSIFCKILPRPLGPCKGGSRDSGFKFQTDQGFWIQISNRAGFWIQISNRAGFWIQISKQFSGIHFSNRLGFWIQIWNRWDSGFRFELTGPF